VLTRVLERRFGKLPPWATRRIADAAPEQLERWTEQLLDVPNLAAILDPDRRPSE